jgi:hypothetical protein
VVRHLNRSDIPAGFLLSQRFQVFDPQPVFLWMPNKMPAEQGLT